MTTGSSWPYVDPNPSGYEAPDGVESTIPGAPDDAGSRDPSATTIAGAVANAYAQMREQKPHTRPRLQHRRRDQHARPRQQRPRPTTDRLP
jgi:hypothetical protein